MSCYFVARINIHDREKYKLYEEGFDQIFANYQGKVVAVDDNPTVLEGKRQHSRLVLIRFPNKAEAKRWYDSAEYQALAQYRFEASTAEIVLVNGRD